MSRRPSHQRGSPSGSSSRINETSNRINRSFLFLHQSLVSQGHSVFIDIEIPPGRDWEEVISSEITNCEFFVVLLTKASTAPGFVVAETVIAKNREDAVRRPQILPIRLAYTDSLPLRLSGAIGHLQHFEWNDPGDNDDLLAAINGAITKATKPTARRTPPVCGDHFIITGGLWQSPGQRESLSGTTIVPVTTAQETGLAVTRANGPGLFGIQSARERGSRGVHLERLALSGRAQRARAIHTDARWRLSRLVFRQPPGRRAAPAQASRSTEGSHRHQFRSGSGTCRATITHERGTNRENFLIVAKESAAR